MRWNKCLNILQRHASLDDNPRCEGKEVFDAFGLAGDAFINQ